MAFRARKSVKLGPGVRLNAGKTGLGVSVGGRGGRYSVHSSGRRTTSVGVPSSGLGYTKTRTASKKRSPAKAAPPPPPAAPKPGLLSPAHEKAFFKGMKLYVAGDAAGALPLFVEAAAKDTKDRQISDDLFAGLLSAQLEKTDEAIAYLERVVTSSIELPDSMMSKYVPGGGIQLQVTPLVQVLIPFGSMAATLALAELYQQKDRKDEAISLLLQLYEAEPHDAVKLSLVELLSETEAWEEVVELAAGTKNEDDPTLAICVFQAAALEATGKDDAALEVYRDALRARKRSDGLLKRARYGRGKLYLRLGKKAQGKKDLGRVYADDPKFEDVAKLLEDAG